MNKLEKNKNVIVVGGGLAGLSAAMRLAENGCHLKIISVTKVKRSHSVCAQGGINAAMNLKGEDDSPLIHAYDTIKGGDFLANQPPIVEMCLAAPGIILMMDRLGCPFNRTPEGNLDFRRFGGTLYNRTAFCGASTGQQLLYSLDEQVRKYETLGKVEKFESHEFMRLVIDEKGITRGVVIMNLFNMKLEVHKADAVVIATGGPGLIFKKSTNSTFCTGAANGRLFMQGMAYANGEFIQIHPTSIPGEDKMRLISESVRGEGGRLWVYGDSSKKIVHNGKEVVCGKTGEPWYFFEELYPAYGNLVPRDIASREILRLCEMGMGIDGQMQVNLDITHLSREKQEKLKSVLEIYEKFTGVDPHKIPMKIFPAVHYSMGGAWVDWPAVDDPDRSHRFRQMTNIPGCFNVGESDYQFHGANRLGANSLLSCIFGGLVTGEEIPRYLEQLHTTYKDSKESIFKEALTQEENLKQNILSRNGSENIYDLHDTLAEWMINNVTVKRNNEDLKKTIDKIKEIRERYKNIYLDDRGKFANQNYAFVNQFGAMLELALVITKGALLRNESRGAHHKEEFPFRDDENWLKTTKAFYDKNEPIITYEAIDIRHLKPVLRDYTVAVKTKPHLENIPNNITLPV